MDTGDLPGAENTGDSEPGHRLRRRRQFIDQLADAHPDCVSAITRLLQHWQGWAAP